jgi:hypothetical protein
VRTSTILGAMSIALLAGSASAAITSYTVKGNWLTDIGTIPTTITFTEVPTGTVLGNQYPDLTFTDGNDTVVNNGAFVNDGIGVNGNGRIDITFDFFLNAVGVDFPGAMTLDLYSGGTLIGSSIDFAGSGTGFFGGVISDDAFDRVVIRDWVDDSVFIDDFHYVPAPASAVFVGLGALAARRRR